MSLRYRFKSKEDATFKEVQDFCAGVWIEVVAPTEEDVQVLVVKHGLEEGHLRDAQDFFEAPRLELEEGTSYFFTRFPAQIEGETTTAPILIAIGDDFVLTVMHERSEWVDKMTQRLDVYTTQKAKFFLHIIAAIEREYTRVFTGVRREVRRARLTVRDVSESAIEQSVQMEYALNEFVSALVPTNSALQAMTSGKHLQFFEEDLEMVEDVQLANAQLIESAKNSLKTIQNIRTAHAALVSNRLNKVVRTLTALTILLTIPTIIGAFYGMNIPLPLQTSVYAFPLVVVATLGVMGAVAHLFVRNRWL